MDNKWVELILLKYFLCLWEVIEEDSVQQPEVGHQINHLKINRKDLEDLMVLASKILEVSHLLVETSVKKQNNRSEETMFFTPVIIR